jgi:predicted O-methyltransferase YrrM
MNETKLNIGMRWVLAFVLITAISGALYAQQTSASQELDRKVRTFLDKNKNQWHDMNVPASDGKLMYDIIVEKGYTRGLEIGTSTGHSTVWIAWAFSKTGGRLITIEIDERRYKEALEHIREAGLEKYVDARLANAHDLVKELEGPFDFVFSDADKDWYVNYFKDVSPKLVTGGCFTAHNVRPQGGMSGTRQYLEYVKGLEGFSTQVDNSGGGMAISYKK